MGKIGQRIHLEVLGTRLMFVGGVDLDGCLTKAAVDEPIFVLLGRDAQAPETIRAWIRARAAAEGVELHDGMPTADLPPKLRDAVHLAEEMERWAAQKAGS